MAGMSNYVAQLLYDLTVACPVATRSFTSLSAAYVSIHHADPTDGTALGTECAYTSYARIQLGTTMFDGDRWFNGNELEFPSVPVGSGNPPSITHWGLWDSLTPGEGQLLYSGALDEARNLEEGLSLTIRRGNLEVTYV